MQELTFGQKAVGLTFNPSGDEDITIVKNHYAKLIDDLHSRRETEKTITLGGGIASQEKIRMYSVAITELQTSQMWAIKALTWKD